MKMAKYAEITQESIRKAKYPNGRLALVAVDEFGLHACKLTVNIPAVELGPKQTIIKNWSENEGVLDDVIKMGLVEPIGKFQYGHVQPIICNVLVNIDEIPEYHG